MSCPHSFPNMLTSLQLVLEIHLHYYSQRCTRPKAFSWLQRRPPNSILLNFQQTILIGQLRLTHHLRMLRPRTLVLGCLNTWTPTNPPSPSFHPDFFRRGSTQHFLPQPQSLSSPRARTALSWTRPFLERRLGSPRRSVHLW